MHIHFHSNSISLNISGKEQWYQEHYEDFKRTESQCCPQPILLLTEAQHLGWTKLWWRAKFNPGIHYTEHRTNCWNSINYMKQCPFWEVNSSYSRYSTTLTKLNCSLTSSVGPITGPYPKAVESITCSPTQSGRKKAQNNQSQTFQRILTSVEALCNRSSIYQVTSTDFASNVTIKCLQFDSPLHCHGCNKT
jgi:hypothetical protein